MCDSKAVEARREHSTKSGEKGHVGAAQEHGHEHDHSHGIFGHSHSHGGDDGHAHGGEVMEALQKGVADRGSRITLIGLGANVLLTSAKGAAGWYMNSAALLADAGHSLSDLLGDFVVLFSWRLSRRPPSARYPYGFAKFETVGTAIVALLLVGGALGIGFHSLSLLLEALAHTAVNLPDGPLHSAIENLTSVAHNIPAIGSVVGHDHVHAHVLDPNAAWFAAASVVGKEWLFRITKKVADQESSPVLLANAYHHRSDAYSSLVALVAIMGSSWFPALPLDPIGGFLVSIVILSQGASIMGGAFRELTDASASPSTMRSITRVLDTIISESATSPSPTLLKVHRVRAKRTGAMLFVDLAAEVPGSLSVEETTKLEETIVGALREAKKEIAEVNIKFRPVIHSEHDHDH